MDEIVLAQPGGLTLRLSFQGSELQAELTSEKLQAETSAPLDLPKFGQFLAGVASESAPPWGPWEYNTADNIIMLQANSDGASGVLLEVSLLANEDDDSDWQIDATLVIPWTAWRKAIQI